MDKERAEEVERMVLTAWHQALKFYDHQQKPDGSRVRDFLVRHIGVRNRRRGPTTTPEQGATVTEEELWAWLFVAPAPHGCLALLDGADDEDGGGTKLRHDRLEEQGGKKS